MHLRWHGSIVPWALALGLAFAVGLNIQLVRTVTRLTVANSDILKDIDVIDQGARLPALDGHDPKGAALRIDYTGVKRNTVVLIFTRTCPFCAQNWTSWSRLLARLDPAAARVVAIDLTATPDPDYYREHGLADVPLLTSVDYRAGRKYKLNKVPTTLLLDSTGTLVEAWIGLLDETALGVLERAVTTPPVAAVPGPVPAAAAP